MKIESDYRTPVGAVVEQRLGMDALMYVICDDGAVFFRPTNADHWEEDAPIPGTSRDAGNLKNGDESR